MMPINQDSADYGPAQELQQQGYAVRPAVFGAAEIATLLRTVEAAEATSANFRRNQDVFAIRNLLGELPALWEQLLTPTLRAMLAALFPDAAPHLVKAIYFDKPASSNWLVAWHQDVMVAVTERQEIADFGPWMQKNGATTVLPPRKILENIITLRLHLDDCDATNGALRVVPGSHRQGIIPPTDFAAYTSRAQTCAVPAGGVMLMKPLTLHASQRSTSTRPRRVIHLEFATVALPGSLDWRERLTIGAVIKAGQRTPA